MSEADEIALRKEQLMAAKLAQIAKLEAGEVTGPSGPSQFSKAQAAKRAARRRQAELLEAMEEVDDSLEVIPEDIPETEDTSKQRGRIDEALAGFGE
ncbi:MAG: hypothetical protein V3T23_08525 [Nitrososphaerales archaeon]